MKANVANTHSGASFLMFSIFVLMLLSPKSIGQTQAPSVQTGVTFQWSDIQTVDSDPATIFSLTIDGAIYGTFTAPSAYAMTRVGPNGHSKNRIVQNGIFVNNNSANANWDADALAAFQDKNLNHYFTSNENGRDICSDFGAIATTDAQIQSLYFDQGIPSNAGGVMAITDRNANNCYYISVYGIPSGGGTEQFLGDTFVLENTTQWGPLFNAPPAGVDYWNTGRVVENGGTLGMALFQLDNLAPVGSTITRVDLTASTVDHGDGKVFILQRYAMPRTGMQCMDFEFNGTIADSLTIPAGSTFSLVSAPIPAGQAFTFNPDGSYSYTPDLGYVGDVVFGYQVCLPAPNTEVCDVSTVTITYKTEGCNHCSNSNADGPLLRN